MVFMKIVYTIIHGVIMVSKNTQVWKLQPTVKAWVMVGMPYPSRPLLRMTSSRASFRRVRYPAFGLGLLELASGGAGQMVDHLEALAGQTLEGSDLSDNHNLTPEIGGVTTAWLL